MNPYVIHCDCIERDFYVVRAIRTDRDEKRIVSSYSCDALRDARLKARDYSRAYKHENVPAPIVYGANCHTTRSPS